MLCHAIIPAEEISGHVEAAQREVLGTAIEHVREASLEKNTLASAVATSGMRLNMTSHSEAPMRGKYMPASARRYCPVIVQVHHRWMAFNLFIRYRRRAPFSPREGYSPGEAAAQRMNRQLRIEVTTTATHVVMKA